jgi:hypothetical protein
MFLEIARCVEEQARCKEYLDAHGHDAGAWMGLEDWTMEEAILRSGGKSNHE